MSELTLEVTQLDTDRLEVVATPPHGRRIVWNVDGRTVYAGRNSDVLTSTHRNFGIASRSALHRAKRYVRAYSKPHGLQVSK